VSYVYEENDLRAMMPGYGYEYGHDTDTDTEIRQN